MPKELNIIVGLPDDGTIRVTQIGPPVQFIFRGSARLLNQTAKYLTWNIIWVGPASPKASRLVPGAIVNLISDPDISGLALNAARAAAAKIERPWFNHPERILHSTRDQVSRRLQGIDGLIMPKALRCRLTCTADIVGAIAEAGLRYPVLVRSVGTHGGKTLVRIDGPDDERTLDLAASADSELYITEFHDFADDDGLYRRYRFAVVGGEPFIKSVVMGAHWNLHASSRIWNEQTIAQERQIIESFDAVLAPRIRPAIDAIYDRLGLDYFGIDCAMRSDGSLLIFEANAAMDILVEIKLKPDLWSEGTARIKSALLRLLDEPERWAVARQQARVEIDA